MANNRVFALNVYKRALFPLSKIFLDTAGPLVKLSEL